MDTAPLLVPIHRELVTLLRGLSAEQWLLPTTAGAWRVREVAAHLLDGQLRRLSFHRDAQPRVAAPVDHEYASVLGFINTLNARWIEVSERLSPRVLVDLLDVVGVQAAGFLASLPPGAPAFWPVAWAGEADSLNWMDVGRDYTEYWHHQQQIRDAVGARPLADGRWLAPVIALGVRALPRALDTLPRPSGTAVRIAIQGEGGGSWRLVRGASGWTATLDAAGEVQAAVTLDALAAARLWYSGRAPQAAADTAGREGDPVLCHAVLAARAVMV